MKPQTLLTRLNKHIKEIELLQGDASAYKIISSRIENNVKTYNQTKNEKVKEQLEKEMDNYKQVLPEIYGRERTQNNAIKMLMEDEMEYISDFIAEHNLGKSPKRLQEIFEELTTFGYTYDDYLQYMSIKENKSTDLNKQVKKVNK